MLKFEGTKPGELIVDKLEKIHQLREARSSHHPGSSDIRTPQVTKRVNDTILGTPIPQEEKSPKERPSFDGVFDEEIDRTNLIPGKSILEEFRLGLENGTDNQDLKYIFLGDSHAQIQIHGTNKNILKLQNLNTGEISGWNGTLSKHKKGEYIRRIALRKYFKKDKDHSYPIYDNKIFFIDILVDENTGMPIIRKG